MTPRTGVRTDAGGVELDVLVFASGFDIEGSICSFPTTGRDGALLRTHFQEQPCAYLGITVPGFPNFFFVLGPNTVLAHSSLIYMIECQVDYILQAVESMAALRVRAIQPRRDRTLAFQALHCTALHCTALHCTAGGGLGSAMAH
jgi:cation diffusion facilitator CzcD-associated flavoprotein CzcO